MTKWTIFDTIDEAKKYMSLSVSVKMTKLRQYFDKIKAFLWKSEKSIWGFLKWQYWGFLTILKNRKKHTGFSENDKIEHFWQNWRSDKIHGPLTKWQNWAFLTKLKKRKNSWSSHKMTKLSIFDKIEEAKKYTVLSQNDKIEHFWQNWRREKKNTRASQKITKLSIFDKIEKAKKVYGAFLNDNIEDFWQYWRTGKNTPASQKMTKLSIFDKIEVLSQNEHFWQYCPLTKWQKMTKLSIFDKIEEKKNTRASQKMTKLSIFDKIEKAEKSIWGF